MKRWASMILISTAFCTATQAEQQGAVIEGIVQLPKRSSPTKSTVHYQNVTHGEVAPPEPPCAVVYLEGDVRVGSPTNNPAKARMEQKHFQFAPGVLPIQKGTAVEFPNLDDDYHNVFSYSKP